MRDIELAQHLMLSMCGGLSSEELHAQDHFSVQTGIPVLRTTDRALEVDWLVKPLLPEAGSLQVR